MLGPSTPFEFGLALSRLAHQQQRPLAGNGPPWCDQPCPGRPATGPYTGISHVHHHCWNCGQEILTRAEYSYDCAHCGVGAGPPSVTRPDKDYDPEFAARTPSPGLSAPPRRREAGARSAR